MASLYKCLVLLDMNGTVCYRSEEPVRGVPPDLYMRHKHYYKRQGVADFVRALHARGFTVCIYSSMMRHNIEDSLRKLLLPAERRLIAEILDRDMNKMDPDGEEEWDTIRDMTKIWRAMPEFNASSTILLDNEARKFKETPRNGIVVPEFGPAEVQTRRSGTLTQVLQYLEGLFEARPADVRTFMEARPFCPSAPGPSATAPSAQAPTVQPQRPSRTAPVAVATTAELDRMMSRLAVGPAAQSLITPASEAVVPSAIPVNYSTTTAVVRPAAAASASIASEADPANAHAVVASSTSPPSFTVEPHATTAATPNATTIAETTSSSGPAAANDLNQAAAAGNQMRIADVPRGVSLLFRCMEGGRFMLSSAGSWGHVTVRAATEGTSHHLRIEPKMDFHRFIFDATEAGVALDIAFERAAPSNESGDGDLPSAQDAAAAAVAATVATAAATAAPAVMTASSAVVVIDGSQV